MKQKVCKCAIGSLTVLFLHTAIAANAAVIQDHTADVYPDAESITDDLPADGWETGREPYDAVGWQEIDGKKYYFLPETGAMASGWQVIYWETYYFSPETGAMAVGWQEINGETYYFSTETGAMAAGWRKIDGERYYFSPENGAMASGWQEIDGEEYYFSLETGCMLHGRQEIGHKVYFFENNGILCTSGWAKTDSETYYCGPQGELASGWKKIQGHKYYFLPQNNQMAVGLHNIKENYYIFHDDGRLAQSDDLTIVEASGKIYCAGPDGKAASGWQIKDHALYYASKKGTVKRNTTFQGITFTNTGAAKENAASRLKMELLQEVASITNKNMSRQTKLAACWSYLTEGKFRYASKYPNLNASDWQKRTAYDMLTTHTGNCYSFACAFAALASEIGYNPYVICGRVHGSRDRSADGYTRHAWVMINGRHYDPEAQYAGWLKNVYAKKSYPASNRIQNIVAYDE